MNAANKSLGRRGWSASSPWLREEMRMANADPLSGCSCPLLRKGFEEWNADGKYDARGGSICGWEHERALAVIMIDDPRDSVTGSV